MLMPHRDDIVLMLAYHYPPDTAIGGARPYRFAKFLKRMGYRVHVIANRWEGDPEPDVTYLPDPFWATPRDGFGWQLELFCRRFLIRAAFGLRWAFRAAEIGRAFIRDNSGHRITIFSTFPPVGSHLAAYLIAGTEPAPWIADFRDPLGDLRVWDGAPTLHKASVVGFERMIMRRVDVVIANASAAATHFRHAYPKKEICTIWNGFDPADRLGTLPIPDRKEIVLTHTGALYLGRTAVPILESLRRLIDTGRLAAGDIKVRLIGHAARACLPAPEFLDKAGRQGWLDVVEGGVPRDEAIDAMRSSNALLLIQPQSTLQVPGKLFEYLLTGHPILAFVPRGSSVEWILENSGVPYGCVHPEDPPAAIDDAVLAFLQRDLRPVPPNSWFEENFNAERQTLQLHDLISTLHVQPRSEMVKV
jgi:hypothetical protein